MASQVNFKVSVQGLANTPVRFDIKYINVPDAMSIVTQVFQNINNYLIRGYGIAMENLFVFVNVWSLETRFPSCRNQVFYHAN